jgi:zona occludens toxin
MSINVYTGLMGSGKSYECVSTVIVDAVAAGRRVVTNVDGIDSDEVRMYAHEKKGIPFDKLGQVDHCKNEDVFLPNFFPHGSSTRIINFDFADWIPVDSFTFFVRSWQEAHKRNFTKTSYDVLLQSLNRIRDASLDIGSCLVEAGEKGWKSVELDYFSDRPRGVVFAPCPTLDSDQTFVRLGDLVCIDEAWRFFGVDSDIHPNHFTFFREHRHYVHPETKVSCDLTLMTQDISDLHRKVKYVVEMSIRTTKLKSLGFSKTYRVEIWEGYKTAAKLKVKTEVKKYDPAVFPLYSSYEGGNGKELVQDSRQNILNSKKLWFGCLALVVLGYVAVTNIIQFFTPPDTKTKTAKPLSGAASQPNNNGQNNQAAAPAAPPNPFSTEWRVVGSFKGSSGTWVVVQDSKGRSRLESPTVFNEPNSVLAIGTIDGQRVSAFSGASTTKEISK